MRRLRIAIGMFLVVNVVAATMQAEDLTYDEQENTVYGEADGVGLVMDIFTPQGKSNGLGIIDIISGAWHSDRGKIQDHARAQTFQILCGKGYTVFAVRPGSVTKFTALEMLDHINTGIRWVKSHAEQYKVDPNRLGMMGASAGGHLACLAAVTAATEKSDKKGEHPEINTAVKAVAVFFPPTDFLNYGGKQLDMRTNDGMADVIRHLAFPHGVEKLSDAEIAEQLKQISPARLVTSQTPPMLLIHGDADPVVPLQQSETMVAALKRAGVPAELIVKPGGGHPWLSLHEEVQKLADWFDKELAK